MSEEPVTLSLMLLAVSVGFLTVSIALHAGLVVSVVLVGKAEVTVEHDLSVGSAWLIDS